MASHKTTRYTATLNGQTFTRTSDRTYTHVVVARDGDSQDDTFRVVGFCGRLDLAEKLAQQTRQLRAVTGHDIAKGRRLRMKVAPVIRNGPLVYRDVTVLPLADGEV